MRKYITLIIILFFVGCATHKISKQTVIDGYGNLHVLYNMDKSTRIVSAKSNGDVLDTTFTRRPNNLKLRYFSTGNNTDLNFEFKLHHRIKNSWHQEKYEKVLVISDLHGRLDAMYAVLKGNGVVDDKLNWIYGKNQLIILGDALDRGRDDNGVVWLMYKLEKEAEKAGGRLDFMIGNHEDLVMKDDIRYVNEEHLIFTAKAGIPYTELYGSNSEQGRWIRDSYLALTVGDNLFVHAGISLKMTQKGYKIGEINELGWRFVGYPTKEREKMHPRNELLFGGEGPLWYRGLIVKSKDRPLISSEDLDTVLNYYKVKRIIVGHSEVDNVDWRYNGRIVGVNVRHYNNYLNNKTAGLLIEGEKLYSVTYSGEKVQLGTPDL